MKTTKYIIAFCLICYANVIFAGINNPIKHFLSLRKGFYNESNSIYILTTDLNCDDKDEVFLSIDKDTNGMYGNIWMVYISKDGEYIRSKDIIVFDINRTIIINNPIRNRKGKKLLTYVYKDKKTIQFREIKIKDESVEERNIAECTFTDQAGHDMMVQSFDTSQFSKCFIKETAKNLQNAGSTNVIKTGSSS